jgi:hypothetical protein
MYVYTWRSATDLYISTGVQLYSRHMLGRIPSLGVCFCVRASVRAYLRMIFLVICAHFFFTEARSHDTCAYHTHAHTLLICCTREQQIRIREPKCSYLCRGGTLEVCIPKCALVLFSWSYVWEFLLFRWKISLICRARSQKTPKHVTHSARSNTQTSHTFRPTCTMLVGLKLWVQRLSDRRPRLSPLVRLTVERPPRRH